jgi:serine protease
VQVPVLMEVSDSAPSGNAGQHYVLLLDRDGGEALDQAAATAEDGLYHYRFTGVAAGSYQILAGSDADNDQFICDAGEACGAYLTLDQPLEVTVSSGNLSGLDFSTGFDVTIHQAAPAGAAGTPKEIRPIRAPAPLE